MRNGEYHIAWICSRCGEYMQTGKPFIGKKEIIENGIDVDSLEMRSYQHRGIECEVIGCTNIGYEIHHWLPEHLSDEHYLWPTSKLCREHHLEWHKLTKTGQWRKRNGTN
jgi:hypothetical protein